MDATAISLCMENDLPIIVFDLWEEGNIRRVVMGETRFAGPRRDEMTIDSSLKEADHKMEQALAHLREDLSSVRTGRASGSVLSRITVEYYGAPVPLNQLASVNVPEPRLLVVQPFDKNSISQIEKAIQQRPRDRAVERRAGDGSGRRPSAHGGAPEGPQQVHHRAEEGRVAVRNVRRHAKDDMEKLEREHSISEDELTRREGAPEADGPIRGIDRRGAAPQGI